MGKGVVLFASALLLFAAAPAFAAPASYQLDGKTYYVVDGNSQTLNSGDRVCASLGLTCIGYTAHTSKICKYFHPNAAVNASSVNGSSAEYYCDSNPRSDIACQNNANTCQTCAACNVNADCSTQIGDHFAEMYVQCASTSTPTANTSATNATPAAPFVSKSGLFQNMLSYWHNLLASFRRMFGLSAAPAPTPTLSLPASTPMPAATPPPPAAFKPCFVNSGSIASMGPCFGPVGTNIVIQVSRQLKQPLVKIAFRPNRVTGIAGATTAEIIANVSGTGMAPGSYYTVSAPVQLCLGGGGTWDAWPIDAGGHVQGDIGRFGITGCK